MSEGLKYDGDKVRMDRLPWRAIVGAAKVLTYGARKYGDGNWRNGIAYSRCYAATMRHLVAWWLGETNDSETGLNHLYHALCEIMFMAEYAETHPEMDDRPVVQQRADHFGDVEVYDDGK